MTKSNTDACPECGARLRPGAAVCDLCGVPVHEAGALPAEEEDGRDTEADGVVPAAGTRAHDDDGVFCNTCGWKNPPGARFCSQCGARLQALENVPEAPATGQAVLPPDAAVPRPHRTSTKAVNRQVGLLVGTGVLLVVALYVLTVVSKDVRSGSPAVESTVAATPEGVAAQYDSLPLPRGLAEQVAALEEEVAQLEGAAQLQKRRELVNLFVGAGRFDRAALEQQKVAEAEDTAEAWKRAGDYYYDWMDGIDGSHKGDVAKLAIAAYQRVLEQDPDNLDVRTDMAVAYLYDPDSPMEAIRQTNLVLEKDPDHVQANFNRGIMLMQINRLDQAKTQFERVKQLVGEQSPIYQQADAVIRTINDLQASQGGS